MIKKNLIKTIIIGFGKISYGYNEFNKKNFLTHYKAIKFHKSFKLLSFIEPNKLRRSEYSKKLKIKGYEKLSSIKNKIFPDLAIIASPTNTHIKIIKEIITNHKSIKTILCEKPFGNNYKLSKKILAECKKKRVKIFVNYIRISDPGVIKTKRIIKKFFSKSTKGVVFYDGSTLNQSSHLINLLQYWFGKVYKVLKIESDKYLKKKLGMNFMLKFKNANIFFIGLNIKKYTYMSIELISKKGRLEYQDRGANITLQRTEKDKVFGEDFMPEKKSIKIVNDINNYQLNVLKQLLLELTGKKNFLCSGDNAIETLNIINKILK